MQSKRFHPLDIIFSCTVCGATLDEVYSEPDVNGGLGATSDSEDGNGGLGSTSDSEDISIVRLYLTHCAHLTCAKHLEGGVSGEVLVLPYLAVLFTHFEADHHAIQELHFIRRASNRAQRVRSAAKN